MTWLSYLCPTRGRPQNIDRLIRSVYETAADPTGIEFVFALDEDDEYRNQTVQYATRWHPENVKILTSPRQVLSAYWNDACQVARGPWFMHGGDDIVFRTKGWDLIVKHAIDSLPDPYWFLHGDDWGGNGENFGTHGILSRHWTKIAGFCPPYFVSDFNDTWFNEVANKLGRRLLLPIVTDHIHPVHHKVEWDKTHQERLARHRAENPEALYNAKQAERNAHVGWLQQAIHGNVRQPLWSLLIATIPKRREMLDKLMEHLNAQRVDGMEIVVSDSAEPLSKKRDRMVREAHGHYVNFLDDDDWVPADYIPTIMEALAQNPDYVGFQLQLTQDGHKAKPTYHSLRYKEWWDNEHGYYRDISHLNPILRGLAMSASFEQRIEDGHEDFTWTNKLRTMNLVKREVYIDRIMYEYRWSSAGTSWRR